MAATATAALKPRAAGGEFPSHLSLAATAVAAAAAAASAIAGDVHVRRSAATDGSATGAAPVLVEAAARGHRGHEGRQ